MSSAPIVYPRDYRLLWSGGLVADVAISAFVFATPLIVLRDTGSAGMGGLAAGLVGIAAVFGRVPGGAFADRHDRRRVMIVSQLCQAIIFLALGVLLLAGIASVFSYVVLAVGAAIIASINDAAENAAITQVVPHSRLKESHGAYQGRAHAANLIGPGVGGILLGVGPAVVPLVAACACAIAVICNIAMRSDFSSLYTGKEGFIRSINAGFAHVAKNEELRLIVAFQFFKNVSISGSMFVMIVSLERSGSPTALIGVMSGMLGACGLLGALLVPVITRRLTFHRVLIVSGVVTTVAVAFAVATTGTWLMAVPLGISLVLSPSAGAVVFARIAGDVSQERLGRILSVQTLSGAAGGAVSKPIVGAAYGVWGAAGGALNVVAAAVSLVVTVLYCRRDGKTEIR